MLFACIVCACLPAGQRREVKTAAVSQESLTYLRQQLKEPLPDLTLRVILTFISCRWLICTLWEGAESLKFLGLDWFAADRHTAVSARRPRHRSSSGG
jgi:hypothetical protein